MSNLEFFQLVLNIYCQGWVHGLVMADKVLESGRKGNNIIELYFESNFFFCIPTDLLEKSLKSPRRSQTRRPVRDALLEYAGPMPFLVVPMLLLWNKQAKSMRFVLTVPYWGVSSCDTMTCSSELSALLYANLTSFLLELVFEFPASHQRPGGNQTLPRESKHEWMITLTSLKTYFFDAACASINNKLYTPRWALSEIISLFSQPFRPAQRTEITS